jgi:glucose-1-phosphate thymidylyltransferase
MLRKGHKMRVLEIDDWYDCGKSRSLLETNRLLLASHPGPLPRAGNNSVEPPVFVDPSAVVENCEIGPFVSIGAAARLKNCRLSDCVVCESAVLENIAISDAIIGNN